MSPIILSPGAVSSSKYWYQLRRLLAKHPILREALLWGLPAVIVGAVLRLLLLNYLPYALWGADTRSHFSFAQRLLQQHSISLDEKRRFLYPILMVPLTLLPGTPLKNVAWLQHLFGLLSLWPFAYAIRKLLVTWKVWIVPITVLYSVFPVVVLFEHEMVGECLLFNAYLWCFAGWTAWVSQEAPKRAKRMLWLVLLPLSAWLLTKPAGRFLWPGLALGVLLLVPRRKWRLSVVQTAFLAGLVMITPFVGSKKLGSLMLYTASFPLTRLETPEHAEYKAEVRPMVEALQSKIDYYYLLDDEPFNFIFRGEVSEAFPHWQALVEKNDEKRTTVCLDLALEGIRSKPWTMLYFGWQRLVSSANLSCSNYYAFTGDYFRQREETYYTDAIHREKSGFRLAAGLPLHGPLPPYEAFANKLDPAPHSTSAAVVQGVVAFMARFDLVRLPPPPLERQAISHARPTLLGWLVLAGAVLSFRPRYRTGLAVWTVASTSYLYGVFVFSETNYRYFAPAWPVLLVLMVLPMESIYLAGRAWYRGWHQSETSRRTG